MVKRSSTAFTLIELLVVIAVVAILAALLLPALSNAKSKAYSIKCMNNLRQLGLVTSMYRIDFGNSIPGSQEAGQVPGREPDGWMLILQTYGQITEKIRLCPTTKT